jgi:hypothetical protein
VIAWLDRLQSSVRSSTVPNPFQPGARAGRGGAREGGGESDDLDENQTPQQRAAQRRVLSDSEDLTVPSSTLVDSDIDPYPDDAVQLGLLAKLSISRSQGGSSQAATRGDNAHADDDDVVRYTLRVLPGKEEKGQIRNFYPIILLIGCRQKVVFHTRPRTEPQVAKVSGRQDERTRHFGL